jgi:MFS transporter, MHS family, proline/betaine transporter
MSSSISTLPSQQEDASRTRRAILAGMIGNVMEWYDFAVYGYFAGIIGQHFFPAEDHISSLLAAFGVFAAGFLMRPIGSVVFGHIGDHVGRKAALTLSVLAMAIPTLLVGLLPTYAQIGVAAPALLVILRLVQGLSVGGEYGTSIIFLVERASAGRRGFFASWSVVGQTGGVLLGSAAGAVVTSTLGTSETAAWGWRVPFLLGITVGLTGLYLRRNLIEDPLGLAEHPPRLPVVEAFRTEWRSILKIFGFTIIHSVGFYVCFVYVTTYWRQVDFISVSKSLDINSLTMLLLLGLYPAAGALSDRIGRKPLLLAAEIGMLLLSWPLFWLMHHPSTPMILLGQAGFAVLIAFITGIGAATMAEVVPRRVRCTAMSIGYNACSALFSGTAPMVAVYLIQRSHNDLSPAFYLMSAAAVSLCATLTLPETAKAPLR